MMTVREIAEVICKWQGVVTLGLDPERMRLVCEEAEYPLYAYDCHHYIFQGVWAEEDYGDEYWEGYWAMYSFATTVPPDHEIAATPEDVEALLVISGVLDTWDALLSSKESSCDL